MFNTIGSLLSGKPVEKWYKLADEKWYDLIAKHGTGDRLSTALELAQAEFESICDGDIDAGKEIMAVTGVAHYYTHADGHGDPRGRAKAQEIYAAISRSNCSNEVHHHAETAAGLLSLDTNNS